MLNKNIIIIVVILVVLIGAFFIFSNKTAVAPSVTNLPPTQTDTSKTITLDLLSTMGSSESGQAILTETDGKTKVTLNMRLAPEDTPQPAHIHVGACPQVGEVKYPLTNVVNGMSETTIDVSIDNLLNELPLAINVHKSVPDAKTYVSCGDIIR